MGNVAHGNAAINLCFDGREGGVGDLGDIVAHSGGGFVARLEVSPKQVGNQRISETFIVGCIVDVDGGLKFLVFSGVE